MTVARLFFRCLCVSLPHPQGPLPLGSAGIHPGEGHSTTKGYFSGLSTHKLWVSLKQDEQIFHRWQQPPDLLSLCPLRTGRGISCCREVWKPQPGEGVRGLGTWPEGSGEAGETRSVPIGFHRGFSTPGYLPPPPGARTHTHTFYHSGRTPHLNSSPF